ncbi:MAG: tail fiber domain-containing protein [Balneolaceae bacterium]
MINQIKKLTLFIFVTLISTNIYAQVPQGFNFQAIARGIDGIPLNSQELGVQVSVIQGSEAGDVVYTETHTVTTNGVGLIQLVIGEGTAAEANDFGSVNWGNDNYYVKLEIDPSGGSEYEELGVSRLLSVPYALLAENVVNGGVGGGDIPLEIDLNTADADSSLIINIEGDKTAKPLQVFSRSTGFNGAIWGEAISDASNPNNQRGTYGFANGTGTGQHTGVFGGAVNFDATGGSRAGLYGQAASKAKYNFGVQALAQGEGSGDFVALGDEVNGDFGSFNIGGGFYVQGNLNGNTGVEGVVSGDKGSRINFGVLGSARTSAEGFNVGIRGEATQSLSFNTALEGEANGASKNLGLRLNVYNGTSNVGMEVNADTAAILNGAAIINGDLTVTGNINGSINTGGFTDFVQINTDDPELQDSLTIVVNGSEAETESALGVNVIGYSTGRNRPLLSQIREDASNNASQYAINGRADGLGGGSHIGVLGSAFNLDAVNGGTRYGLYGQAGSKSKLNIGAYTYATGTGNGELVAIGEEVDGNFGTFNIGYGTFVAGNANGNNGVDVEVGGDQGSRINIGAEFRVLTTASGQNSGVQAIVRGSSSLNRGFFGYINGDNDNVGMELNVEGGTTNKGLVVNAETAAELNGDVTVSGNFVVNGNIEHTGSLTQTSDRNLKENIQPLQNGLSTIMKLNPTTYNFRGNGEYNGLKLSTGLHYGLIAQEVEQILPNLVKDNVHHFEVAANSTNGPNDLIVDKTVESMDYKTMNYTELIPVLIKAVQEQQDEIEKLKKEVERLKSEKK